METAVQKTKTAQRFSMGVTGATVIVSSLIAKDADFAVFVYESIQRHRQADWGDLNKKDKQLNEAALTDAPETCGRLFSRYNYAANRQLDIYIITEPNRRYTTILFPTEY